MATFNIRNMVALDWKSCWFRRRSSLAAVIREIEADVWAMQEAYRPQVRYLNRRALPGWTVVGNGRNLGGGGEACPIWVGPDCSLVHSTTLWFGDRPEKAGSKLAGAFFPRMATIAVVDGPDGRVVVANTHLDEKSVERRRASLVQLLEWLSDHYSDMSHVVLGDLNATLDSPPAQALLDAGYASALTAEDGPTSNGFGDEDHAKQIDHVFASTDLRFGEVSIRHDAGLVSDHWPVLADLHKRS
ncbi:MAG: endonuclease/exonuclease/phosphatase family protein [Ilumatobacteraceae bacterium]